MAKEAQNTLLLISENQDLETFPGYNSKRQTKECLFIGIGATFAGQVISLAD